MASFAERRLEDRYYINDKYQLLLMKNLGNPCSDMFNVRSFERSTYKKILEDIDKHPDLDISYILRKRIELLSRGRTWPMMRCKQELETLYLELYSGPSEWS